MVRTFSRVYGSIGYGCQSFSWSAEHGKIFFPCPRSRLRFWYFRSHISPPILHTQAESDAYSRAPFLPLCFPRRRPSMSSTATGSVPCLSSHTFAFQWCSLPRVRRHRSSYPQVRSNLGCFLSRYDHGPIFARLSFSTPTTVLIQQWICNVRWMQHVKISEVGHLQYSTDSINPCNNCVPMASIPESAMKIVDGNLG